jgi:hypothetical protein
LPILTGGWVTEIVLLPKSIILFDQNAGALIFNGYYVPITDGGYLWEFISQSLLLIMKQEVVQDEPNMY